MTKITIESLNYRYESGKAIFADLSLEAKSREFLVLVGPSGCGKSTLLRLISGLERSQGGKIKFDDVDVSLNNARERNVSMVFQNYALYPHFTVRGNLELALKIARVPSQERATRVEEVARYLEISELLGKKPAELSGGQRQRVAMGRALVRNPSVFLFDEPLSNLDAELRARLRLEIKKVHREFPATKIYVTHDQVEAMTLADRIVLLKEGQIQQVGSPHEIYNRPKNLFVAQFIGSPAINLLEGVVTEKGIELREAFTAPYDMPSDRAVIRNEDLHFQLRNRVMGQRVMVGFRPERFDQECNYNAAVVFTGKVTDIENLGATCSVVLNTRWGSLRLSFGGITSLPATGDLLSVRVKASDFHVFDKESGETYLD